MILSSFFSAGCLIAFPNTPNAYLAGVLPDVILLYFWFQQKGWEFRLFSISLILFMLTDASAYLSSSYSSPLTAIFAILSLFFLILGFLVWKEGYTKRRGYLALIAVAYGLGYYLLILDTIPDELKVPIGIYASLDAIIFVVVAGLRLKNNYSYVLCLFGVSLFILADAIFAYHFFIEPFEMGEPLISVLHNITHVLFIFGILEEYKTDNVKTA